MAERTSSVEAVARMLNKEIPGVPNFSSPAVDVRDVAMIHYLAFMKEGISGERILAT